jgi:transcriptional regulator with XRE-family HTH domain
MVDRILSFLKIKKLNPSQFADAIGIQRSGMSHLISGRNKPSLDFIQKTLQRFPDLNSEWLLSGTGPMLKGTSAQEEIPAVTPGEQGRIPFSDEKQREVSPLPQKEKTGRKKIQPAEEKEVEKIVWFYTDRTFTEYFPE